MTNVEYNRSIERTDVTFIPGASVLESAQNKKNSDAKRSKSKRNPVSKGGSLLKAYFPNLISNKDPLKAKGSDLHPQKKKLYNMSRSQHGDESATRDFNLLPGGVPDFIN